MVQRLYSRMLAIYIRSRLQVVRHSDWHRMWGMRCFPVSPRMVRRSLLRDSTTVTRKCTRCPLLAVSHCVSLTRLRIAVMIWAIAWARIILWWLGHRTAMVLFTATASAMGSPVSYIREIKKVAFPRWFPCPRAAFVAIRPTENNWLTTG